MTPAESLSASKPAKTEDLSELVKQSNLTGSITAVEDDQDAMVQSNSKLESNSKSESVSASKAETAASPADTPAAAAAEVSESAAATPASSEAALSYCLSNDELYEHLTRVSRSFAITIPFLKQPLRDQVALAYLICRIVDTVEDDAAAALNDKISWLSDFSFFADDEFADEDVLQGLKRRALDITKAGSQADYIKLVNDLERTVHLLQSYDDEVQEVVCHAVAILAHGMVVTLRKKRENEEISTLDDVDNYCYSVAGVVGEMLAELFCLYDHKANKKELLELAVSFGEGLQLTNILRDRAQDAERGVTFLPQIKDNTADSVLEFVALTQGHLDDAIKFICKLPARTSSGVRMFCLTNVAMAMFLLRQVSRNPLDPHCDYKISRPQVKRLFLLCRLAVRSNNAVSALGFALSLGMKAQHRSARHLRDKVSLWDHSSTN